MSKKGGLSKQARRQMHEEGVSRPPVRRTHAGLAPSLYTALHNLRRPTIQPLTIHGREALLQKIHHLRGRVREMEKSLQSARDVLEVFSNEHDEWVRAQIIRMMDSISSSLAEGRQSLTRLEAEERADEVLLSLQMAYELQELEVRSHLNWIGRLDRPRDSEAQPPKLTLRSSNIPSPIKRRNEIPMPSTSRQATMDEFLARPLDNAVVETPVAELEKASDKAKAVVDEDDSDSEEEVEHFSRCVHQRLHRICSPKDLTKMKKALMKSCARTCGQRPTSLRRLTLYKPLPQKLKVNLDEQFRLVTCEKKGSINQNQQPDLIELPTVQVRPTVVIPQVEREAADAAMEQVLQEDTVEVVTVSDTVTVQDSDSDISVIQLDGNLNTEAIFNLDENVNAVRNCTGWAGVDHGAPVVDPDADVPVARTPPRFELAIPNPTGRTPSLSTPRIRYLDHSVWGQRTFCACSQYDLDGHCSCSPRIPADE